MNADIQTLINDTACVCNASVTDKIKIGLLDNIAANCAAPCTQEVRSPGDYASGLSAWYSPEGLPTGLSTGDTITQWNDGSGNGYHLVQDGAVALPVYRANARRANCAEDGFGCADFTAASQQMMVNESLGSLFSGTNVPFTVFALIEYKTLTQYHIIYAFSDATLTNPYFNYQSNTGNRTWVFTRDNAGASLTPTFADLREVSYGFALVTLVFTAAGNVTTFNNQLAAIPSSAAGGTRNLSRFCIGAMKYGAGSYTGWSDSYIVDIAIFNSALSAADQASVEDNYYNWKYGLW